MWYIYKHPNFIIPKEFQDWLVWAWDWQHNWTTVTDISWNWNNWTQANVVFSRKNNAHQMSFNGSSSKIWISWHPLNIINLTVSTWVYINSTSWIYQIMWEQNYGGTPYRANRITISYWKFTYGYTDNWNTAVQSSRILTWLHHLVITRANKQCNLYIDWKLDTTWTFVDTYSDTQTFEIWDNYNWWSNTWYFNWKILSPLIYNKVLTPQQISKMYEYFRQWYYN